MENKKWVVGALLALVLVVGLCACRGGQVAPQIVEVEKPVVVEKEVPKIVEVEKPVIVEKEVLVEKVVTKTVPITITVPVTVEVPVEAEELTETEVVEAPQEVVVKVVVEHVGAPAWPAPVGVMVVPSTTHAIVAAPAVSVTTAYMAPAPTTVPGCLVSMTELETSPYLVNIGDTGGSKLHPWDKRANGMVSWVQVCENSSATFEFEWWGPEGVWNKVMESHNVRWGPGVYDLEKTFYPSSRRDLNDTLQRTTIHQGTIVLCEHDTIPRGICITLTCPTDPS